MSFDQQHFTPFTDSTMDPSSSNDKPPFMPYYPTDVKQRRRTSRAQVIVLEDAYSRTTKPDSPLRISLAERLDMTPRGVQVWFQNRRAKDKMLRKKAAIEMDMHLEPGEKRPKVDNKTDFTSEPKLPQHVAYNNTGIVAPRPIMQNMAPSLHMDFPRYAPPPGDILSLRRGSAPAISLAGSHGGPIRPSYAHEPTIGRRASIDRFAPYPRTDFNPTADAVQESLANTVVTPLTGWPRNEPGQSRPQLIHRASMSNFDSGARPPTSWPFAQTQHHYHAHRPPPLPLHREVLDNNNSRSTSSPIPGPLPSPTFTFGAVSDVPITPPEGQTTFLINRHDPDTSDDGTSEVYDMYSRFGSLASESSATSAFLSERGSICSDTSYPPGFQPDMQRGSMTSLTTPFMNLMGGMSVELPMSGSSSSTNTNVEEGIYSNSAAAHSHSDLQHTATTNTPEQQSTPAPTGLIDDILPSSNVYTTSPSPQSWSSGGTEYQDSSKPAFLSMDQKRPSYPIYDLSTPSSSVDSSSPSVGIVSESGPDNTSVNGSAAGYGSHLEASHLHPMMNAYTTSPQTLGYGY